MNVYRKYVGKLTWLVSITRLNLVIYVMESARRQKNAMLKDLRNINRILEKVRERENKVIFSKVASKEKMCIIGVSDASYKQEGSSVVGEMIMIGNTEEKRVAPIFWKSGVIHNVCTSPKQLRQGV